MSNNIFDDALYRDSICSVYMNNLRTSDSNKLQIYNESDLHSNSFKISEGGFMNIDDTKMTKAELLNIGLMKSLTICYCTIKEFQSEYQTFYQLEKNFIKSRYDPEQSI